MNMMPPQNMPPQGVPQQAGPGPQQQDPEMMRQGPQPVKEIGFNQDIQNVLFSRVQTISEQEIDVLDKGVVSPQAVMVLAKILPELEPLLAEFSVMEQMEDGGGVRAPMPPQAAQGGVEPNPLSNPQSMNPNLSRGLVGV